MTATVEPGLEIAKRLAFIVGLLERADAGEPLTADDRGIVANLPDAVAIFLADILADSAKRRQVEAARLDALPGDTGTPETATGDGVEAAPATDAEPDAPGDGMIAVHDGRYFLHQLEEVRQTASGPAPLFELLKFEGLAADGTQQWNRLKIFCGDNAKDDAAAWVKERITAGRL